MIKHIVLIKLKPLENKAEKSRIKEDIKTALEALPIVIPEILRYSVEYNVNGLDKSADLAIVSEFATLDTLDIYRVHPEHVKVVAFLRENCLPSCSIDYEF